MRFMRSCHSPCTLVHLDITGFLYPVEELCVYRMDQIGSKNKVMMVKRSLSAAV
jgi:hypothetical protein